MLAERLSIDRGKVDLALVLLSQRLQLLSKLFALGWFFGENVRKRNASLERHC